VMPGEPGQAGSASGACVVTIRGYHRPPEFDCGRNGLADLPTTQIPIWRRMASLQDRQALLDVS
jgi:hypothetical protein